MHSLLQLSEQRQVFTFVRRNRLAKRFASRFVAGETADEGARAAERLAQHGITATLDLLGESVHKAEASEAAAAQYVALLERMAQSPGIEVNASVKLTQMGFDLDEDLCFRNVSRILDRARDLNGFVRIDMEGSAHTQRTLDFFSQRLLPVYGTERVGVVIQSALRRSAGDIDRLIALGARVRLCKGAAGMTYHIYLVTPATGEESVVEEGHKGLKGKPSEWATLASAEAQVDYWRATSAWNRVSDPCPFGYAIREAT